MEHPSALEGKAILACLTTQTLHSVKGKSQQALKLDADREDGRAARSWEKGWGVGVERQLSWGRREELWRWRVGMVVPQPGCA